MLDLIARACETHAEAVARAEVAADRAFLKSLIYGSDELLSEDAFQRMEPMFARYPEGSEMFALLEKAATVFSDAVQELAARVLDDLAIDEARQGRSEG